MNKITFDYSNMSQRQDVWRETIQFVEDTVTQHHLIEFANRFSIVVVGSFIKGSYDEQSDVDVFVILPDNEYDICMERAVMRGETQRGGDWRREIFSPFEIAIKFRSFSQVEFEIESDLCKGLWIYKDAVVISDPDFQYANLIGKFTKKFRQLLPTLVSEKIIRIRQAPSFISVMMKRNFIFEIELLKLQFIQNIMECCFLIDGAPFPYSKWLRYWCVETQVGRHIVPQIETLLELKDPTQLRDSMQDIILQFEETASTASIKLAALSSPNAEPWFLEKYSWRKNTR